MERVPFFFGKELELFFFFFCSVCVLEGARQNKKTYKNKNKFSGRSLRCELFISLLSLSPFFCSVNCSCGASSRAS